MSLKEILTLGWAKSLFRYSKTIDKTVTNIGNNINYLIAAVRPIEAMYKTMWGYPVDVTDSKYYYAPIIPKESNIEFLEWFPTGEDELVIDINAIHPAHTQYPQNGNNIIILQITGTNSFTGKVTIHTKVGDTNVEAYTDVLGMPESWDDGVYVFNILSVAAVENLQSNKKFIITCNKYTTTLADINTVDDSENTSSSSNN